jgi:hypothetical protein
VKGAALPAASLFSRTNKWMSMPKAAWRMISWPRLLLGSVAFWLCQRAHVVGGGQVFVVRVVSLQDVLAVTVFGDHPQQVAGNVDI